MKHRPSGNSWRFFRKILTAPEWFSAVALTKIRCRKNDSKLLTKCSLVPLTGHQRLKKGRFFEYRDQVAAPNQCGGGGAPKQISPGINCISTTTPTRIRSVRPRTSVGIASRRWQVLPRPRRGSLGGVRPAESQLKPFFQVGLLVFLFVVIVIVIKGQSVASRGYIIFWFRCKFS